eukprot:COSAG06_NODE_2613_length_6581_cov_8.338476_6_plen_132_part_00
MTTNCDRSLHPLRITRADYSCRMWRGVAQNIPLDYRISFEITPQNRVQEGWSNIFHITATGQNCCNYGDRIPGVWFYPGGASLQCTQGNCPGHRMHVVHGSADRCSPSPAQHDNSMTWEPTAQDERKKRQR